MNRMKMMNRNKIIIFISFMEFGHVNQIKKVKFYNGSFIFDLINKIIIFYFIIFIQILYKKVTGFLQVFYKLKKLKL